MRTNHHADTQSAPGQQPVPGRELVLRQTVAYRPRSRTERWLHATAAWCTRYLTPALLRRRADIEDALEGGWVLTADWIKATVYVGTAAVTLGLASLLADWVLAAVRNLTRLHPGLVSTVTGPLFDYLQQHGATLHVSTQTLYSVWVLTGMVLLLAASFGSLFGRMAWTGYGAASAAMIWSAAPAGSRTVAAGVAVLLWTLASLAAFKGARFPLLVNVSSSVTNISSPPALPVPAPQDSDDDIW